MQKEVEVGFLCDREARCGDETTYLMSMLQNKLDRTKVKNHFKLAELSTKIEQSLAYEDALFFEYVQSAPMKQALPQNGQQAEPHTWQSLSSSISGLIQNVLQSQRREVRQKLSTDAS